MLQKKMLKIKAPSCLVNKIKMSDFMSNNTFNQNKKPFYSGRIINNVRSMARGSCFSFWNTLALAQGHQRQAEEYEGREKSLSRQIRNSSDQPTGEAGHNDKGNGGDEFRIRRYEEKYLKNKRKIQELENKIITFIANTFKSGEVSKLPMSVGLSKPLPGGIQMKLLHVTSDFDLFICTGGKGDRLLRHQHSQHQTVYVLKGKLLYLLEEDDKEREVKKVLEEGERIEVRAHRDHELRLLEETKYLVVFRPPISFNPLEMEELENV